MMAWNRLVRRFGCWLILLSIAPASVQAGKLYIRADGLKADSPQTYAVYSGTRRIATGQIGEMLDLEPGTYALRVGFPSGWVSQEVTITRGRFTLPTGLFQFEQIDLPGIQGTVPQSLYHVTSKNHQYN